jgi:hypothetical protein
MFHSKRAVNRLPILNLRFSQESASKIEKWPIPKSRRILSVGGKCVVGADDQKGFAKWTIARASNHAGWSEGRIANHLIHYHVGTCLFLIVVPNERHSIPYRQDSIASFIAQPRLRRAVPSAPQAENRERGIGNNQLFQRSERAGNVFPHVGRCSPSAERPGACRIDRTEKEKQEFFAWSTIKYQIVPRIKNPRRGRKPLSLFALRRTPRSWRACGTTSRSFAFAVAPFLFARALGKRQAKA